jgi:hypothetical protein
MDCDGVLVWAPTLSAERSGKDGARVEVNKA